MQKIRNIIIIVALVVVAVAIIVALAIGLSKGGFLDIGPSVTGTTRPTVISGINISIYPSKMQYYVGEEFDPKGLKVQVVSNNNEVSYFVDASSLEFSGFDSTEPNDSVVVTVKYLEYTTQFTVKVKEREGVKNDPEVVGIKLSDNFKSTYTLQEWNDNNGPYLRSVRIVLIYSDGSEETLDKINVYDFTDGVERHLDSAGTTQFKVLYQGFETTVTVTITE